MKIIVLVKTASDTKIPLECDDGSGRLKAEWNVSVLNPDDGQAIAEALQIKSKYPEVHIRVVHLGPPSGDRFLREALALGCDEGLRIWDEGLEDLHPPGKIEIFGRVAAILGFDLLFTGTKSADTGSAQLGILLADALGVPCLTRIASIDAVGEAVVQATRRLDGGYQEEVESARPLVIAVEADQEPAAYASLPAVARAVETAIPCFDLAQIGVPLEAVRRAEARLAFGPFRLPAPRLQFVQSPDSSLPAFERRRLLGEGPIVRRQGRIASGNEDAVVNELFQTLLRQGWLEHLRKESEKA